MYETLLRTAAVDRFTSSSMSTTTTMNPIFNQRVIDRAVELDPLAAAAEYHSEFRRDVETFLQPEALDAVRLIGRRELPFAEPSSWPPMSGLSNPAGGTGEDSMTMAIAHDQGGKAVLDVVREVRPPFSPEATVAEFADTMNKILRLTQSHIGPLRGLSGPRRRFARSASPSSRARARRAKFIKHT